MIRTTADTPTRVFDNINPPKLNITRGNQLKGLDRFFTLEKSFVNPYGNYYVGIYSLKKDCNGVGLSLPDIYHFQINKIIELRTKIWMKLELITVTDHHSGI